MAGLETLFLEMVQVFHGGVIDDPSRHIDHDSRVAIRGDLADGLVELDQVRVGNRREMEATATFDLAGKTRFTVSAADVPFTCG
jgi:hypothetical protein